MTTAPLEDRKLAALLSTLTPMDEVEPYFRGLIYGDSGVGKTVLACTIVNRPNAKKALFIDSHEGWVSLLNHKDLIPKLHRMQYAGVSQLEALVAVILDGNDFFQQFDTIILDEASTMAVMDLDIVLAARSAKDPSKDKDVATQPDFYSNTERMRRAFNKLMSVPMHLVLVAHIREDKDERTGRMYTRPNFMPKLRLNVERIMHVVGNYTSIEKTVGDEVITTRRLQVHPTLGITAKTRIGGLPIFIENPDLGKIVGDWAEAGNGLVEVAVEVIPEPDAPASESMSLETSLEI